MNRLRFIFLLLSALATSAETHWSLQPISRPATPEGIHPVDYFVEKQLGEKRLQLSPAANREVLLRRVTLDLIGLPPTVKELDDFRTDKRPTPMAFAAVVDRLLASPRYGERWAQHWLDVIRWAETVGFETNTERPAAWHYRDWVIAAFNRDLPYDRFIRDQLAGDVTGADAALGFWCPAPRCSPGRSAATRRPCARPGRMSSMK